MKKFFCITITLLFISIFILFMQRTRTEDSTAVILQKAFDVTGAEIVCSEVYIRGKTVDESLNEDSMRQLIAKEIISGSGGDVLEALPVFQSIDNDIVKGTETQYIIDDEHSIYISIVRDVQEYIPGEYNISVRIADTSGRQAPPAFVTGITDILRSYGVEPEVNISITGCIKEHLSESEVEQLCSRVFKSISADKVEGISDDGLISVSAFSPSIREAIRFNGKRVNVNLASRYNSYEGKTYIWLATPVIMTEY